jgi:hypothetical protein
LSIPGQEGAGAGRAAFRVSVTLIPLGAALSLAGPLGALLDKDFGEGLFL